MAKPTGQRTSLVNAYGSGQRGKRGGVGGQPEPAPQHADRLQPAPREPRPTRFHRGMPTAARRGWEEGKREGKGQRNRHPSHPSTDPINSLDRPTVQAASKAAWPAVVNAHSLIMCPLPHALPARSPARAQVGAKQHTKIMRSLPGKIRPYSQSRLVYQAILGRVDSCRN